MFRLIERFTEQRERFTEQRALHRAESASQSRERFTEQREESAARVEHRPGAAERVGRGGSWFIGAGSCRVSYRLGLSPGLRNDLLGLRFSRPVR